MSFVVYRVESRRLKTPTAIPWAESIVAVPYPSYLEKIAIRRDPLKRNVQNVELNVFPSAPEDSSTFLPAWFSQKENRSTFNIRRLDTPQLDEYPFFVDSSTFLPAWLFKAANQSSFNVSRQEIQEFDLWPATPPVPEQPLTAFLLKKANIKAPQIRKLQLIEPLFVEPASVVIDLIGINVLAIIINEGIGVSSTINNDGIGVTGIINNDGIDLISIINNDGVNITGVINNLGINVEGGINDN